VLTKLITLIKHVQYYRLKYRLSKINYKKYILEIESRYSEVKTPRNSTPISSKIKETREERLYFVINNYTASGDQFFITSLFRWRNKFRSGKSLQCVRVRKRGFDMLKSCLILSDFTVNIFDCRFNIYVYTLLPLTRE